MENQQQPTQPTSPPWEPLPDERLPRPNYFPAGLAMGSTFIAWGIITSLVIFFVGVGLFVASLAGWITELCHARKKD